MTKALQKAFAEAAKLPESEQDSLGRWLLEEFAAERRWDAAFGCSHETLEKLADEAMGDHRSGRTREVDPDRM